MVHYDLFAGIGGFSYALDQIFYDREIKHIFCEWGAFPTAVLKKRWPEGIFFSDISDLVADTNSQRRERVSEEDAGRLRQSSGEVPNEEQEVVVLTGGFPCQPFSVAGRRKGTADNRYLWPEMFRVIQNVRPDWIVAENVRGLVTWNEGMVLETVCADLESEGYEVQPLIIPAVAVGAPHRRDRVWIIANTRQQLRGERGSEGVEADTTIGTTGPEADQRSGEYTWADDWREVAAATCIHSLYDGFSFGMDGITISGAKYRKEALKAYGNAIVPQVAREIFRAIKLTIEK